jgi:uncharacterized protein YndB with AHSA1/START domain
MNDRTNTVKLHRVLRAPAERVYKAFLVADALCRWLPPYGFLGTIHQFDSTVGGGYRMSFTNFENGQKHSFETKFIELVPNERIRHLDRFDDPNLPGEMDVMITFRKILFGTELRIEQRGIPEAIPVEMCYHGWQESLLQLANLVEHEIPST